MAESLRLTGRVSSPPRSPEELFPGAETVYRLAGEPGSGHVQYLALFANGVSVAHTESLSGNKVIVSEEVITP